MMEGRRMMNRGGDRGVDVFAAMSDLLDGGIVSPCAGVHGQSIVPDCGAAEPRRQGGAAVQEPY